MAGKGQWLVTKSMRNCASDRCPLCKEPGARPHGPYYMIYRRNPDKPKERQHVYIGRHEVDEADLFRINELFGRAEKPAKEEILSARRKTKTVTGG